MTDRRSFLCQLTYLGLSCSSIVQRLGEINVIGPIVKKLDSRLFSFQPTDPFSPDYIIDLHCHPNLKAYLWGKKIWKHHPSKKGDNIFNMQTDIDKLSRGNVRGLLAAHYLPEKGLKEESKTLRFAFPLIKFIAPEFATKIEKGSDVNFEQLYTMLDEFEEHVKQANKKLGIKKTGNDIIKIAGSFTEFEKNINAGIITVVHAIEGSHVLGRNVNGDFPGNYKAHVEKLFQRGVCLITLAHFFQNDLAFPVEGIPPSMKSKLKISWKYFPVFEDKPLTPVGRAIAERMLELGMLIDITHLSPRARAEIFLLNEKFNRPILFSHTGVQKLFKGPPEFENFKYMGVSDEEIEKIRICRGVIGVIFMNYWLVGCDTHMKNCDTAAMENGIDYVIATIEYIRQKTGTFENVALGSDFDGFADSPADLKDASFFPVLVERIRKIPGITPDEVAMITHKNAFRVLKDGWKK